MRDDDALTGAELDEYLLVRDQYPGLVLRDIEVRTAANGETFWYARFVDAQGTPRVCVSLTGGLGGHADVRRCPPQTGPI